MTLQTKKASEEMTENTVKLASKNLASCPICGFRECGFRVEAPDRFHGRSDIYKLRRCPSCSIVWLQDPPEAGQMSYHYGAAYHAQITSSGEENLLRKWRAPRERVLAFASGGSLLDIGCSSGGFLQTFKGGPWRLFGIEVSPNEAKRAERNSGAAIFVGEILDAPYKAESFDVITGFHVLEHMDRPKEVVSKVWEWLKPGGVFYIHVPNIDSLESTIFGSYWYGLELPRHLFHYSPNSLRHLFGLYPFEELVLRTQPDCYVEKSIHYVLDNIAAKLGSARQPLAGDSRKRSLSHRILRKGYRVGVQMPFRKLAAAAGRGSAIEAAFRKYPGGRK